MAAVLLSPMSVDSLNLTLESLWKFFQVHQVLRMLSSRVHILHLQVCTLLLYACIHAHSRNNIQALYINEQSV